MLYTGSGDIPKHLYCYVDSTFIRKDKGGFEPCIWFGVRSCPGQAWGLHVVLECGAIYRNLPPHSLAFRPDPVEPYTLQQAQMWDCYGEQFAVVEYRYLSGLKCELTNNQMGRYLFTIVPMNDAFTHEPEQSKEFSFIQLESGRLTIQPTNRFRVHDKSFTEGEWPRDLKVSTQQWRVE